MGLMEDVDKTIEEVRKTLEQFDRISAKVEEIEEKDREFEREFGFTPGQAAEALGSRQMVPEERRKYEEEQQAFNEEMTRELAAAEDLFRRERMQSAAPKNPGARRRSRAMI